MMNKQVFDISKDKGRRQFDAFLKVLLDYNAEGDNDDYNEIHIYQEEMLMIVEWNKVPYSHEWGGKFQYIDYDEYVMKEVSFPDGHYEYLFPDEVEEKLEEWHKSHPEWVKTYYGTWTNMEENRRSWIEWQSEDWMKKEVQENDSTFDEKDYEINGLKVPLESLLGIVSESVLRRTNMIVIGADTYLKCINNSSEVLVLNRASIIKMKSVDVKTKAFPEQEVPDDSTIHIYVTDYITDNGVYYVTNEDYLIYRVRLTPPSDCYIDEAS